MSSSKRTTALLTRPGTPPLTFPFGKQSDATIGSMKVSTSAVTFTQTPEGIGHLDVTDVVGRTLRTDEAELQKALRERAARDLILHRPQADVVLAEPASGRSNRDLRRTSSGSSAGPSARRCWQPSDTESPAPLGIADHPSVVPYSRSPLPARFGFGPTQVPAPQNPPVTQAVPSVQVFKQAFDWQRKPLQLTGAFALQLPTPITDRPLDHRSARAARHIRARSEGRVEVASSRAVAPGAVGAAACRAHVGAFAARILPDRDSGAAIARAVAGLAGPRAIDVAADPALAAVLLALRVALAVVAEHARWLSPGAAGAPALPRGATGHAATPLVAAAAHAAGPHDPPVAGHPGRRPCPRSPFRRCRHRRRTGEPSPAEPRVVARAERRLALAPGSGERDERRPRQQPRPLGKARAGRPAGQSIKARA